MNHEITDCDAGTRARKWLGIVCRPALRVAVRCLLHLCPDTPIVANVSIGKNGNAFTIEHAHGAQIINVRVVNYAETCVVTEPAPMDAAVWVD